jgi:hypothetical protein
MAKTPLKKRRRMIPKFFLVLAYAAAIAFLGGIFFLRQELRRMGFFGKENVSLSPPVQSSPPTTFPLATATPGKTTSPPPSSPTTTAREDSRPSSPHPEEITNDDKQQLDAILRRSSKE